MSEQHKKMSGKSVAKLALLSVIGVVLAVVLLLKLSQSFRSAPALDEATAEDQTLLRIKPVAQVVVGEAQVAAGSRNGEAVFTAVCAACHATGVAGAPKLGDAAAWGPRNAQGFDVLVAHALNGFQGKAGNMPAKGGGADLTDDEVKRAVAYMANKAGANFTAPEVKAGATAAAADVKDGKTVYDASCTTCHAAGIAGAPKFGDKSAWGPRIAQGKDTLYQHAIAGFVGKAGAMPAKGGNAALADAEVKAAVDYMLDAAK